MRLGKLEKRFLNFIREYKQRRPEREGWVSYQQDYETKRIIKRLEEKKLIQTNEFGQFRAVYAGRKGG